MRLFLKWPLAGLLAVSLTGLMAGCGGSGEVERADVPAIAPPPPLPEDEVPETDRPTEGSSAGMDYNPTRGAVVD
ncbi:hypothetical protein [Tautonia rosea]|uniref:hypothetical protein n=1 Tax=Tautonia rosea TaxID=2728037 RepID=UPI0014739CFF|nr:hypothetical protein [Tautonia rosea]